jgi:trehalose utilization protein
MAHDKVSDEVATRVQEAVLKGMGIIVLHSGHKAKVFMKLMGTTCNLKWRDDDRERLWTVLPSHPIAQGVPEQFEVGAQEMYGEPFDIPTPDELVFMGWFRGGEVFRSGCCYRRGLGKVFYFQPGHETNPTYHHPIIQKIITNAVHWAKPLVRVNELGCPNTPPVEEL